MRPDCGCGMLFSIGFGFGKVDVDMSGGLTMRYESGGLTMRYEYLELSTSLSPYSSPYPLHFQLQSSSQ